MTPAPLPLKVGFAFLGLGVPLLWLAILRDIFRRDAVIRWDLFDLGGALIITGAAAIVVLACATVVLS